MKRYKVLRNICIIATLVLSHWTCIAVSFGYSQMLCGIAHKGFSAPADVVFLAAIPYYIGIILFAVLAFLFHRKTR